MDNFQGTSSDTGMVAGAAFPDSKVDWASILSSGELAAMPERDHPDYLSLCEKIIENLTEKLAKAEEREKVSRAESQITGLMAQLQLGSGGQRRRSSPLPASTCVPNSGEFGSPPTSKPPTVDPSAMGDPSVHPILGHYSRPIVDSSDGKEYVSKLRMENHLVPVKPYDQVNYRELMLGMDGVHSFLISSGRAVMGYESHCHFIRRKAVSFLYTNLACVLYDKYVTDRVISGEFYDYPAACADASLEFFSDTYRRDVQKPAVTVQKGAAKPWSGYPYPYCYFFNEGQGCFKKNCSLKHECGFCHTKDHRSKDCVKSTWKSATASVHEKKSDI